MRSRPTRFGYERGTQSATGSKCGGKRSTTSTGVVPKGGRSADVMRADDWNLIEHDESDRVRPFNLAHALGQTRNPRTREPGQVDQLCIWLGAWRNARGAADQRALSGL